MAESHTNEESLRLLEMARRGQPQALGQLLQHYEAPLLRILRFRIDPRLRQRMDAEDVLQEAFVEASQRFATYLQEEKMPFFLWLRFISLQKLFQLHRQHLGVQARDASREVSIDVAARPAATSAVLAANLLGQHTSPSRAAMRAEAARQVEQALNSMTEMDREVLALRRFEKLSNQEVAEVLNISKTAASNRYIRALERLRSEVEDSQSGIEL